MEMKSVPEGVNSSKAMIPIHSCIQNQNMRASYPISVSCIERDP